MQKMPQAIKCFNVTVLSSGNLQFISPYDFQVKDQPYMMINKNVIAYVELYNKRLYLSLTNEVQLTFEFVKDGYFDEVVEPLMFDYFNLDLKKGD